MVYEIVMRLECGLRDSYKIVVSAFASPRKFGVCPDTVFSTILRGRDGRDLALLID